MISALVDATSAAAQGRQAAHQKGAALDPATAIPSELKPWIDWVKTSDPTRACPFTDRGALCAWPGQLELALDEHGGSFALPYLIDQAQDVALAGSLARWPEQVKVDGKAAAILARDGRPIVHLTPGSHRIEGRFAWKTLPERIELPHEIALLALQVKGSAVPFPRREDDGSVWLGENNGGEHEVDELSLSVQRQIADGVPLIVTTRLILRVSGRARELSLGNVLLPDTAALSLSSDLPARLHPNGELLLQARAGTHRIEIIARTTTAAETLRFKSPGAHWPSNETWVWQADDALRQVSIEGVAGVDAARTELDEDWKSLPAYLVREDTPMKLTTQRRGEPTPAPNRVNLVRELWLDLDGRGYTVRDQLAADMKRDWRLNLEQGTLGHVSDGVRDLLITQNEKGQAGIELRDRNTHLTAEWRADEWLSDLPAVAWSENVQSLQAGLHLGPGYSVLAASGVDNISQSWIDDWDLFGCFFVLIVSLAFGRLFGWRMGLLAFVTLVLTEHEQDAPRALWFALLLGTALLHLLHDGTLRNAIRAAWFACVVALLGMTAAFAADQIRTALYPQLAQSAYNFSLPMIGGAAAPYADAATPTEAPPAPPMAEPVAEEAAGGAVTENAPVPGAMRKMAMQDKSQRAGQAYDSSWASSQVSQQDPEAVVQTGPGLPNWNHGNWQLRWSGPVDRAQHIHLWLITPTENRVLSFLRAVLLGLLAGLLLAKTRFRSNPNPNPQSGAPGPMAAAVSGGLLLLSVLAALGTLRGHAHADAPSADLLKQLEERVAAPPACRGNCVSLQELSVDVSPTQLILRLQSHAQERSAIALPGPAATWLPESLSIDGKPASAMLRDDGFLVVRLDEGVHVIEAKGPLPQRDSILLAITEAPHHTEVSAQGWAVDGVRDDGQVEGSLLLSRLAKSQDDSSFETQALPEWLELERVFQFGTTWQVLNTLRRVSPIGTPVLARIPLLPGESITDAAYEVKDGALAVSLPRDGEVTMWTSTLSERPELALSAAKGTRYSEHWVIDCSAIWRCEAAGLAPLSDPQSTTWRPSFRPWPGESLRIALRKPKAAKGQSTTIDDVRLELSPGQRVRNATLELHVRSSRGGSHEITLSTQAHVQTLQIDGQERALQQNGARIGFTLPPGEHHVRLEWQETAAMGFTEHGAHVVLDGRAVNVRTALHIPSDRWLLWARGPAWGPAVLFWGRLLLVVLLGLALGKSKHSPLRQWQWMLLGFGLTQIEMPFALIVVGWFFVMQARANMKDLPRWPHNLAQIALVWWTIAALSSLYGAVQQGLLVQPDMQVAGAGSTQDTLRWYSDQAQGVLPDITVFSAPLWIWRMLMLAWALWLAASCLRWLPWAVSCLRAGAAWKKKPRVAPVYPPVVPPAAPTAPAAPPAPPAAPSP